VEVFDRVLTVMMCAVRVELISSIIAASVVLLPDRSCP
jgi:hypothetical protein